MQKLLNEILEIEHPIIVAPMFLISNVQMVVEACEAGATAAIPALNYRTNKELKEAIQEIKRKTQKPFGINLIVNKSNPKYLSQLDTLLEEKVAYIITSLGNPLKTIEKCKERGIKVFCDIVDLKYAHKVEAMGADAIIAVNSRAGGHSGVDNQKTLLSTLSENISIPIISAGGITNANDVQEAISLGACGVSVGTIFLASQEAPISMEYKQALIDHGEKDIVLSTKFSGSHLTVINTPYIQEIESKSIWWHSIMHKNKTLKKYVKMIIAIIGMNKVRKSAFQPTYKSVWCAGPSIEKITSIRPLKEILSDLI